MCININLQPNKKVNVPLLSAQIVTRIQNGSTLTTRTPVKHHHHAARFRFMLKKIYVYTFIYFLYIFFFLFYTGCFCDRVFNAFSVPFTLRWALCRALPAGLSAMQAYSPA